MIEQPSQVYSGRSASCGIAVMAKSSVPGLTKTRLVPPLTYDEAAAFNTAFLQDVAANIGAAAQHAAIEGYMAFGPPGSEGFFKENLGPHIGLVEVWLPDFGDCLQPGNPSALTGGSSSGAAASVIRHRMPVHLRFMKILILERKQAQQDPVKNERPLHGIGDDAFAVHPNLHLRDARGRNRVQRVQIDRTNQPAHRNGLILGIDPNVLCALNHQVSVG